MLAGEELKMQAHDLMATGSPRRELAADRLGMSVRTLDRLLTIVVV